jgi:hypothetical protein
VTKLTRAATGAVAFVALAIGCAVWLAQPAGACACGVAIEATVSEEQGLVIEQDGSESIVLSLDLNSDGTERAAVVLPVPGEPTVEAVKGGDPLAYLDVATQPAPAVGSSGGGDETAGAPPVDVIGRETVGGYDVARLGSGDAAALDSWLRENGYTLPAGAEPILAEYVDQGWRFVAIRLAPESDGPLKPLAVGFETGEYVYPMKLEQLATEPLNLTLFTLAAGERQVDGLETVWAGTVDELSPQPPAEIGEVFAQGGYVTRLEAIGADPARFTEDLQIDPVGEELEPGTETTTTTTDSAATTVETGDEDGVSTAGVLALIAAGLAFAIGIALITRPRRG